MPRHSNTFARNTRLVITALGAAAGLTGCYTSSNASLGFCPNPVVQDRYAVTDSVGAAMFAQQVRLAHAQANEGRLNRSDFATDPLTD